MQKIRHLLTAVAAIVVTSTLLSACSLLYRPVPIASPADESVPANLTEYYDQQLDWSDCGDGMYCAEATVPLDYAHPEQDTITIAMIKHPAAKSDSLGALFMNPGGPGGSGVAMIRDSLEFAVGAPLTDYYDVIGFDPRGVGASTAVKCYDSAQMDEYIYGVPQHARGEAGWLDERIQTGKQFAAACEKNSGNLLPFVDTISAARDLDILRSAVEDPTFNYLGYSYGTLLGATYADLFPTHVGRMVLDGAMDPSTSSIDVSIAQAQGFEQALRAYLVWCFAQDSCPFDATGIGPQTVDKNGAEVNDAMTKVSQLLSGLETQPRQGSDGRYVGGDVMLTAIIAPLYSEESWSYLTGIFDDMRNGDADSSLFSADWYFNRNDDGTYADNSNEANSAINCIDYPSSSDRATWEQDAKKLIQAAPVIGPYLSYGDAFCSNWPAASVRTPAPVHAQGASPILVVGTVGDPATPYQWAVNLSQQLSSARLITYEGEGHTAYNGASTCVNKTVEDYFVRGTVPQANVTCPA